MKTPAFGAFMPIELSSFLLIAGRVLLGGLFVYAGVSHFFLIPPLTQAIAARGVPAPRLVLIAGSIFQIVMGGPLMLGMFVPIAVPGLIAFTVAASFMLVNFWDRTGPERALLRSIFLTNFGIIGGLLIAAAHAA